MLLPEAASFALDVGRDGLHLVVQAGGGLRLRDMVGERVAQRGQPGGHAQAPRLGIDVGG